MQQQFVTRDKQNKKVTETVVEVGGKKQVAQAHYSTKVGKTISLTCDIKWTTKLISFDEAEQEEVLTALTALLKEAYYKSCEIALEETQRRDQANGQMTSALLEPPKASGVSDSEKEPAVKAEG